MVGSIIGIIVEVKRWRQTGVIANNFRVVGRIQPFLSCMGIVADVVTDWVPTCEGKSVAGDDLASRIDTNYAVVKLIADQRVAVVEPHRPSGRRCGDTEGVGIRDVLPNHLVVGIYLDGAGVACISKQGVPVNEATGERDGSQRSTCRKGFDDLMGASDLDGPIIVFVGNQNVPVFEQLAGVRAVKLVRSIGVRSRILPDNFFGKVYLDYSVVALVSNEDVKIRQPCGLDRRTKQIETRTRLSKPAVLPDYSAEGIDKEDAIIRSAIRCLGDNARRRTGTSHKGERPDALGIVDAYNRPGGKIIRPAPERPEDVPGRVDLNHTIVELVRDEDIAGPIEPGIESKVLSQNRVRKDKTAGCSQDSEET